MIHVDSITTALFEILQNDPVLVSSGYTIQEGEALNRDINQTPWVGLYYGSLTLDPHTLGGLIPWKADLELFLYVQEGSHRSGQEATRLLSRAQSAVLQTVCGNRTIGGTVLSLSGLEVTPFQRDLSDNQWLFTNEIAIKAELRG
ncbi:MAG: hypothetical protein OEZ59_02810 [Deltaproteobacteria bacterium]|nr:hypothetical protein [Deltaproteobacteria bacterium]